MNDEMQTVKDSMEKILFISSMMYVGETLESGRELLLQIGLNVWKAAVVLFGEKEALEIEKMAHIRGDFFLNALKETVNGRKTKC